MIFLGDSTSNTSYWLVSYGSPSHDGVSFEKRGQGSGSVVGTTDGGDIANDTWYHFCASDDGTTRSVYLDGGRKNTDSSTEPDPSGVDRLSVGAKDGSSPTLYFDGKLGHVGVWNVALTDAEVLSLATGLNPLQMRPGDLKFYWPMNVDTNLREIVGQITFTLTNGPVDSPQEPLIARPVMQV